MKILSKIDGFLNSITMYRLVMYGLAGLALVAIVLSVFGTIHYSFWSLVVSFFVLAGACFGSNYVLAKIFKAPTNSESSFISAFILFFILVPIQTFYDLKTALLAAFLAMLSKYILAYRGRHIFNPIALSIFLLGLFGSGNIFWWVGGKPLLPFVLILSLLVVRKLKRFSLFLPFLATSTISIILIQYFQNKIPISETLPIVLFSWPIVFFGGVMLTEPFTTPPTKKLKVLYGLIVGLLFGVYFKFGPLYSTPEFALLVGNLFSYVFSLKRRIYLSLLEKKEIAKNIFEFTFKPNIKLKYKAGQFMEFTFDHEHPDSRGERRYFTIASSPTETDLKIGLRLDPSGSTFKKNLQSLPLGGEIVAGNLDGDFTLAAAQNRPLVFIAGGIGITPFRSMIKYLIDQGEKREVVLFYSVKSEEEIAYREFFEEAKSRLDLKTIYVLSNRESNPNWSGETGFITKEMIFKYIKNPILSDFYLSGPNAMVENYKKMIRELGLPQNQIHTDYFPGY